MITKKDKNAIRQGRHQRIRNKISGTAQRPRMSVYRSLKHIYVQIIDDEAQTTCASASTMDVEVRKQLDGKTKVDAAKLVGEMAAKRAMEKGIKEVVFDRGGFIYQGKIAALAEAAREAGLEF